MGVFVCIAMQSALSSICVNGISAGGVPLNVTVPTMSAARKTGVAAKVTTKRKIEKIFVICVVKFITRKFTVKRFVKFFTNYSFRRILKIVMPIKSPAWPSEIPSQPQPSQKNASAEIVTDNPPQIKGDSFSNSAARQKKTMKARMITIGKYGIAWNLPEIFSRANFP